MPVDRGQRAIHPIGPNFDNRLPQTLANGTVVLTPITDLVSWNARNFMSDRADGTRIFRCSSTSIRRACTTAFSADFFNALNHPNDYVPNATTGLIDMSRQLNPPRIIQLGARLEW